MIRNPLFRLVRSVTTVAPKTPSYQIREYTRPTRILGDAMLAPLAQDVRYALRQLRKSPAFTTLAVLTLALGIGASAAVFSIFDAVLFRPLPYRDPSRLAAVWSSEIRHPGTKIFAPFRDFEEFKSRSRSFESLAALTWAHTGEILTWHGSAHQVLATPASRWNPPNVS